MAGNGGVTIVKKIKKGGHGHHGGAWKVAYADFVTAMMAFFLLLWLLNSVTQEQLEGISNYFAPVSTSASTSGSGGMLEGQTMQQQQSTPSPQSSVTVDLPPPSAGQGPADQEGDPDSEATAAAAREEEQFETAQNALRQALESIPNLQDLAKSLLVDATPEGLRIQIVDQDGLAMFPSGRANMFDHTKRILGLVAQVIKKMPQMIAIAGHTDAVPFNSGGGYGNWELSADRANASRRALIELGVPESRINRVVGKASEEPLLVDDPNNPRNRRISIILLRGTGKQTSGG